MRIRRFLFIGGVIAGWLAWMAPPAMATCEELDHRMNEIREELGSLEEHQGGLHEELGQTDDPDRLHQIDEELGNNDRHMRALREELRDVERQRAECDGPPHNGNGNDDDNGIHPLVIAAIISAVAAILVALIGLKRR